MCGSSNWTANANSDRNLACNSPSAHPTGNRLMATERPRTVSVASHTSPIPLRLTSRSSRYGPNISSVTARPTTSKVSTRPGTAAHADAPGGSCRK
jgi:hypothetical protein